VSGDPSSALLRRVGARIAELRRARGWTQEALAEFVGTNVKHLQNIERGEENLTLRTIDAFAVALGGTPADLLVAPATTTRRPGRPSRRAAPPPVVRRAPLDPVRLTTSVPMLTLVAAAGDPDGTYPASFVDWVEVPGRRLARGLFVARVQGDSMAPRIPDGAHALFRAAPSGDLVGRVVLVALGDDGDDGHAQFVLKKVSQVEHVADDQARIRLVSINPRGGSRWTRAGAGAGARVVAELVEVLDARE
jgi:transcriptional regulator with XRE-family HTH domain